MEILCNAVGPVCRADSHILKDRRERRQLKPRHRHPHHGHPAAHVGHRRGRRPYERNKGSKPPRMVLPPSFRCLHGPVVAVLFQGPADGRRVARGTRRQAQRCHHHHPRLRPA